MSDVADGSCGGQLEHCGIPARFDNSQADCKNGELMKFAIREYGLIEKSA